MPYTNTIFPAEIRHISTTQQWELMYWTNILHCTINELKAAIAIVGNTSDAVATYLNTKY